MVESIDGLGGRPQGVFSSLGLLLHHGGRQVAEEANLVLIGFGHGSVSEGSSEDVLVLLLGEVDIIVSVRMGVLDGVVSVVLPG